MVGQRKRCVVLCVLFVLQSGHFGVGYVSGSILCLYSSRNGDLPILSWASVRLCVLFSVCSVLLTGGGWVLIIGLVGVCCMCSSVVRVCICLQCALMFSIVCCGVCM